MEPPSPPESDPVALQGGRAASREQEPTAGEARHPQGIATTDPFSRTAEERQLDPFSPPQPERTPESASRREQQQPRKPAPTSRSGGSTPPEYSSSVASNGSRKNDADAAPAIAVLCLASLAIMGIVLPGMEALVVKP